MFYYETEWLISTKKYPMESIKTTDRGFIAFWFLGFSSRPYTRTQRTGYKYAKDITWPCMLIILIIDLSRHAVIHDDL